MTKSNKSNLKHRIPVHLRQYIVEQNYDSYTPIDQAVWRYVMRQNRNFLKGKAHPIYLEGLENSGIRTEYIPKVEEMTECLEPYGWSATIIDGFIPGVVFFDFQAHGILPIATEIRTLEHIEYTPAPDIIHEAAGHAPILCDQEYSKFVKSFGEIGSKALSTKEELEVFEAIKHLSKVMENKKSTAEEIRAAEENLRLKQEAVQEVSEAEMVSRLYWWTVEYGLIGDLDNPQIYGAGLLSSIGESKYCMTDEVKKLPFDLEQCINTGFDITKPQPQLFVCDSFKQLNEAIEEFSKRMAFVRGGTESLQKALKSGATATAVYSSGLQVTGTFTKLILDTNEEAIYLNTTGPTSLAYNHAELPGHGKDYHHHGFGSPIGTLVNAAKGLEDYTDQELTEQGIQVGMKTKLSFQSGICVEGIVKQIQRENDKILLISFDECTVTYGEELLFQPEWGVYDMAVGSTITSVFAGAADRVRYYENDTTEEEAHEEAQQNPEELEPLDELYLSIRKAREEEKNESQLKAILKSVAKELDQSFPNDWLLRLEILEMSSQIDGLEELSKQLEQQLIALREHSESYMRLIDNGLKLVDSVHS